MPDRRAHVDERGQEARADPQEERRTTSHSVGHDARGTSKTIWPAAFEWRSTASLEDVEPRRPGGRGCWDAQMMEAAATNSALSEM